jgi:hypothetical protein
MRRGVMRRFEGLSYREWEDVRMLVSWTDSLTSYQIKLGWAEYTATMLRSYKCCDLLARMHA